MVSRITLVFLCLAWKALGNRLQINSQQTQGTSPLSLPQGEAHARKGGPRTSLAACDIASRPWTLVTGASSGLGAAIAQQVAARGYNVMLVARRRPKLAALSDLIAQDGGCSVVVEADLATAGGVKRVCQAAGALNIDLLVLNAGVCRSGRLSHQSQDDVNAMLALNIVGNVALLRACASGQLATKRPSRVLVIASSAGAAPGIPGVAVYAATKAFLRSLTAGVGAELRRSGTSVTCALPCAIDTEFASQSGLEQAAVFTLPGVRKMGGVVMSPEAVARRCLAATLRGKREVVPGFLPWLYVTLTDYHILPAPLSRFLAAFCFGPSPFKQQAVKQKN